MIEGGNWEYLVNTLVDSFPAWPVQEKVVEMYLFKKEIEAAGR